MTQKLTPLETELLEALELAEYKIGEMLMLGFFEEAHKENLQKAQKKINAAIAKATGAAQ